MDIIKLVIVFIYSVFLITSEDPSSWKPIANTNGIKIFESKVPGSSVIAIAGETMIDAPIGKVASVLMDVSRRAEWSTNLKEARILELKSKHEWIEYNHVETPIFIRDRDFVLEAKTEFDSKSKHWWIRYHSVDYPDAPKTKFIRGDMHRAAFRLKSISENQTEIWAEAHGDPKGAIPKWIVNLFCREWPRLALEALKKQVAKPDITELNWDK